jgi:Nuf2 family
MSSKTHSQTPDELAPPSLFALQSVRLLAISCYLCVSEVRRALDSWAKPPEIVRVGCIVGSHEGVFVRLQQLTMAAGFSFPVLNNQDLLPCLREMELPLDEVQLSKPTYEAVRPVFESVVAMLMGVTRWVTEVTSAPTTEKLLLGSGNRCTGSSMFSAAQDRFALSVTGRSSSNLYSRQLMLWSFQNCTTNRSQRWPSCSAWKGSWPWQGSKTSLSRCFAV